MNEEKEENKIFEETSTTNKIGIFTDFNNYIMYKVSPSSSSSENKALELEDKAIRTLDIILNICLQKKRRISIIILIIRIKKQWTLKILEFSEKKI